MYLGIEIGGTKLQLGVGVGDGSAPVALERLDVDQRLGATGILAQIERVGPALIARHGVTRAKIRSAVPLSPELQEEVSRVFGEITGKRVIATVEVVPELIAGIIVEVEGRVYDGSLRTQLGKLHQQMAGGA